MTDRPHIDDAALLAHAGFVQSLARQLLAHDTDDVSQDALLIASQRAPSRLDSLRAWLATTVRRLAIMKRREQKRRARREELAAIAEAQPSAADLAAQREVLRQVTQAVLALREPYQSAILLRYYQGLPPREMAAQLGISVDAVKARLKRGLAELRAWLDAQNGGRIQWAIALLPLTVVRAPLAMFTTLSLSGGLLFLKTKFLTAASIFALLAVTVLVIWPGEEAPSREHIQLGASEPVRGVVASSSPPAFRDVADRP